MRNNRRRCKECKEWIYNPMPSQIVCSYQCSLEYARKKENKDKYIRANKKEFKANNVSKSDLKQKAQKLVNEYVRLRDSNKPCISCGHKEGRQFHAGHYRPMGNNQQIRYYTLNIFKQCSICNNYRSGNLVPYRETLINRFDLEWVEALEANHETKKYSIEYLERLILVFRKKIKLYKKFR